MTRPPGALIVLWEASDRVCGKRLKALLPILLPALERNGHLKLEVEIRCKVLSMSAATIDRLLQMPRHATLTKKAPRVMPEPRRRIKMRTFADWKEPPPGNCVHRIAADHLATRAPGNARQCSAGTRPGNRPVQRARRARHAERIPGRRHRDLSFAEQLSAAREPGGCLGLLAADC